MIYRESRCGHVPAGGRRLPREVAALTAKRAPTPRAAWRRTRWSHMSALRSASSRRACRTEL